MKKIFILSLIVVLSLTGCAGETSNPKKSTDVSSENISENTKDASKETERESIEEPAVQEEESKLTNVKIISTEVSAPIGDRTADNIGVENGEYMDLGEGMVKCSDYDNIHVVVELTNNRDKLITTNAQAWSAKMSDGYELAIVQDSRIVGMMYNGDLEQQLQSGSTVTLEFDILKEKSVTGDTVVLTYWDVDLGEEFNEFMKGAMSGISEEEMKKDYPQFFDESLSYTFEIPLN